MRLSDAAGIFVQFGPGQISLIDLIDAWSGDVLKYFYDTKSPYDPNDRTQWGVDDLTGSMYLRAAVQQGIDSVGPPVEQVPALTVADELFRSFTEDDRDSVLATFDPELADRSWWWIRIPKRGPISEEIEDFKRQGMI